MTDAVFQLDRGLGVRFWGQLFEKRLDYFLDIVNSFNSTTNRTITPDPAELDNNPGVVFHMIWHALGDNPEHDSFDMLSKDFNEQADLARHESPALDVGFHYAFNEDDGDRRTTRIPFPLPRDPGVGGFGLTTTNGLQINQLGLDAAFKYLGFSATTEYIVRLVDPRAAGGTMPWTSWWERERPRTRLPHSRRRTHRSATSCRSPASKRSSKPWLASAAFRRWPTARRASGNMQAD